MANVFISYGDDRFKISLDRIVAQAKRTGVFDKIIRYTLKDLPPYITASPLMAFQKGGGYWCWKPYVIYHTLQNCKEGDIVYYCDAGCTLDRSSEEWAMFQEYTKTYNAVFFQYREGFDYGKMFRGRGVAIKNWTKGSVSDFFRTSFGEGYLDYAKIWGGFMIFKKTPQVSLILEQWYKITLFHPEWVMDPMPMEHPDMAHRHDQSILTPLVYRYQKEDHALILPETSESRIGHPAVLATRWRQGKMNLSELVKYRLWLCLHPEK